MKAWKGLNVRNRIGYIPLNGTVVVNNKLDIIRKEAAVASLKTPPHVP
jgi:hypothetical protein